MKSFFLFTTILLLLLPTVTNAQLQLSNNDLEEWTNENDAVDWNTLSIPPFFYSLERSEDANQGTYAAKLETGSIIGQIIPGMLMLGEFDLEAFLPTGGVPFTERPTGISAFIKYFFIEQDTMAMLGILTKWNETEQERDTIAATIYFSGNEITQYTNVTVPFVYFSDEIPDTINVGFISSGFSPVEGSTLYVDDIVLEYGVITSPTICMPATNINPESFNANWVNLPTATDYLLDVAYDENFDNYLTGYENFSTGIVNELQVTGLEQETEYFYRIRVEYDEYLSDYSNYISLSTTPLGIINTENETPFDIYVSGKKIIISSEKYNKTYDIEIFDINGKNILTKKNNYGQTELEINYSGFVFIGIRCENKIFTKKMISLRSNK